MSNDGHRTDRHHPSIAPLLAHIAELLRDPRPRPGRPAPRRQHARIEHHRSADRAKDKPQP